MTRHLKFILTLTFGLTIFCAWTQTNNSDFSYVDTYGNNITIVDMDKLPANLDTTFFKLNLSGLQFDEKMTEKKIRYYYFIRDVKQTKKENEFVFVLHIVPKTKEIEEILKYTPGLNHYSMTLKKVNDNLQIAAVEFLYGEI